MPDDPAPASAPHNAPDGPLVGVGALVIKDGRVLLIQRGRFPGIGAWAIPGGKQRFGETLQQTAEREILEETGVTIRAGEAIYCFEAIFDDEGNDLIAAPASAGSRSGRPAHHYVVIDLAADYLRGEPRAGDDATQARWLTPEAAAELPLQAATRRFLAHVGFLKTAPGQP